VFWLDEVRFGVATCAEAGPDDPFEAARAAGTKPVLFPAAPGLDGRRRDTRAWRDGFRGGRAAASATPHPAFRSPFVRIPPNGSWLCESYSD
jgi:hypothetical protein